MAKEQRPVIPVERIVQSILRVRGQKVLLDADLAKLYGVTTKRLNEQVRRNLDRFPEDFLFQLTDAEYADLRSQIATSTGGHGGRRYLPLVFTEHGAIMAASVLNTPLAVSYSMGKTEVSVGDKPGTPAKIFLTRPTYILGSNDTIQRSDIYFSFGDDKTDFHRGYILAKAMGNAKQAVFFLIIPAAPGNYILTPIEIGQLHAE